MPKDDNHDAVPSRSPSDSDHHTSSSGFPHTTKLRGKLNKLAKWRIDLSSIEFVSVVPEFHGGYATVSQAFLVSSSSGQDRASLSNPTKKNGLDVPGPTGEASRQRKDLAVKKMKMSDDPARILGLALREAEFLVGLSHENVIKLEGYVEDLCKDVVWLVFPWAENGNLKNFIASAEWEIPERIWLIYDVARGVEYLHSQQPPIRHGDLKSINILVNSEYRAVITDFGSARHQTTEDLDEETSHPENKPSATLSLEPAFCGATNTMTLTLKGEHFTLRWAAPELLHKKKATLATDIWAFGCVVYEVMTNSIPFQDIDVDNAVIIRVVTGNLPSITEDARMALIKALCSLALECWSEDHRKRPAAQDCRKEISWMPMIRPNPIQTADAAACRARSPALLMQLGVMYRRQGDYVNASDLFSEALGSYKVVGDSKGEATALIQLADVHQLQDEYSQAVKFYSEALQILTEIGDRKGRAEALWGLAEVYRHQNEYSQAVTFYTEALEIRTDISDRQGRAEALWGLAEMYRLQNEYSQAMTFHTEALEIRTDIGDRQGRAHGLVGLADVHRLQDEYSQAVKFYSEALQIRTDIGDRQGRAYALWGLAEVHRLRDEYSQAVSFYAEALQICTDIGDRKGSAEALWGLAEVHRYQNEYSQAVAFYSEDLQIRTDIGDRRGRADALWGLAEVHRLQNQYSEAIQLFSEALQFQIDIGDRDGTAWTLRCLGDVHRDQDQHEAAARLYKQAAGIFGEIENTQSAEEALSRASEARQQLEPAQTE